MPNLETDLTGDVLEASPSLVAVERVVRRHYKHYQGYPLNRTWGILIRSAEHETRMLHLALLVWVLALTTASTQDEVVLSGQITAPHDNPVAPRGSHRLRSLLEQQGNGPHRCLLTGVIFS